MNKKILKQIDELRIGADPEFNFIEIGNYVQIYAGQVLIENKIAK